MNEVLPIPGAPELEVLADALHQSATGKTSVDASSVVSGVVSGVVSSVAAGHDCFHCGLPVPASSNWHSLVDGTPRAMCCPGCAAVADTIIANGFGDYYSSRTAFGAQGAALPPELALLDRDGADHANGDEGESVFSVDAIRCAACVWLIERSVARVPGVFDVQMNVTSGQLHVRSRDCKPSTILAALRRIGYSAYPYDPARHAGQLARERKRLFRQLFIAGLSMMQVMMYALPVYLADDGTMDRDMTALMQWAALLLTLPAVLYSAQPFFGGAWRNLKQHMLGMDVPVAIGIGAAFGASVVSLLRGQGDVYFDSVTMFIFLLLGSRYLELSARRKAAQSLEALQHGLPASATRLAGYPQQRKPELVAATELREGEHILVAPGQAVAADGVIVEGESAFDLALLTGESAAQAKSIGAEVPGGAINGGQPVVLRVTRAARQSTLAMLVQLVERAGRGKPKIALWADRVAAWFVAALLLLALAVFLFWHASEPARAWQIAIAVLVVSCPCALSLATPTALAAATDRLLRRGVLVVAPHVLETLHRATHVIFDKTGTLTYGRPMLHGVHRLGDTPDEQCRRIAAALEEGSAHPLGHALRECGADLRPSQVHATGVRHVTGQGVEGHIDGMLFRLGSAAFVGELCAVPFFAKVDEDVTPVYLASSNGPLARFDLSDALRDDALAVVRQCQAEGKTVIVLSGDRAPVARHIAAQLGIAQAFGDQLPEQKLAFVRHLQANGAVVAMVGDGMNDAAVMRTADVSFAMGGGAALAQLHADAVLMSGRLASLGEASSMATRALAVVRQNLAWATIYNLVAIPAAAMGMVNPWMSGVGMSLSSAVVVLNALRLRGRGA
jgi:Cu2+-exporting ATPase